MIHKRRNRSHGLASAPREIKLYLGMRKEGILHGVKTSRRSEINGGTQLGS
jgi:hypothetical protein